MEGKHDDNDSNTLSDRFFTFVARVISRHTWKVFFFFLALMLLLTMGAGATGAMNLSEDNEYVWIPARVDSARRRDAIEEAQKLVDAANNGTVTVRATAEDDWTMFITYENHDGGDIFQPKLLQEICNAEAILLNHPNYPDYCVLEDGEGSACAPQSESVVNLFYGTSSPNCTLLASSHVQTIADHLYSVVADNTDVDELLRVGKFVGSDFAVNGQYTKYTKSVLSFGSPLAGFIDGNDREDEQMDALTDNLLTKVEEAWFKYFGISSSFFHSAYRNEARKDAVQMKWWAAGLQNGEFQRLLGGDMAWAVLSIGFVFVWVVVHTNSFFVSIFGMLQIVLSIPVAAFIYGLFFDYFDILHILTIYLVLGIGADDIFVYTDAWRQSINEFETENYQARVKYAYSRTARAVLNTSFTTAVAFLSQTGSALMPIATLGIYASIAILLNFAFAITFTPAVVLLAEKHFGWCGGCCCRGGGGAEEAATGPGMEMQARATVKPGDDRKSASSVGERIVEGKGNSKMDIWLDKYLADFMTWQTEVAGFKVRPVATVLMLFMLGWAVQAAYFAFQLTPPNEQEQWFPSDHMWTGFFDDLQNNYVAQSDQQYVQGEVVYGIKGIDRKDYDFWKPGVNLGDPVFDPDFDIYPLEAQESLLRACEVIKTFSCDLDACQEGLLTWPAQVQCFFDDFQQWMNTTHSVELPSTSLSRETFLRRLIEFRATSWAYEKTIGVIDGELKFVTFPALTTVSRGAGFDKTRSAISRSNELPDALVADSSSPTLKTVFFNGGIDFVWFDAQKALISNLFSGLAICTPVVFVLLMLATKNLQISLVAVMSVLFIVASVLGVCKWAGWSLGVAEAIAGVIVIGFSVDYTLHLGHMYMEASQHGFETREGRFRFAVHTMGSTVIANSITTFGSGVVMFAAQFTFFQKMGTLMCSTIAFSLLFSIAFFLAHCAAMGPQHNFANLQLPSSCRKTD